MSRYSKIDRRVWGDEKFQELSAPQPCGQFLWLYLLTTPKLTTIPGLFSAGEAELAEALGWPLEVFRDAFLEIFQQGMIKVDWKRRLLWIPGALKYNAPESPNVVKSWRVPWDELPECELKLEAWQLLKDFTNAIGNSFGEAFIKSCPKPSIKTKANQEQEQKQEQKQKEKIEAPSAAPTDTGQSSHPESPPKYAEDVDRIFRHWQTVHGHPQAKLGDSSSKRYRVIVGRLKDGYSADQLCAAVDGCKRSDYHMGRDAKANPTGTVYDDIELICRDQAHVDRFIRLASGGPVQSVASRIEDFSAINYERGADDRF